MKKKFVFLALITGLTLLSSCTFEAQQYNSQNTSSQTTSQTTSTTTSTPSEEIPEGTTYMVNESNPVAYQTTIKEIINMDGNSPDNKMLYAIRGTVQAINDNNYGNFDIVDSTGSIYVYGCSKAKTSIRFYDGKYTFSNNASFSTLNIKPGDFVFMEGIHVFYSYSDGGGVHEFQGYVTAYIKTNVYSIVGENYQEAEPAYSGDYYNSLSSATGSTFATELHNLMDTTHTTYTSYSSLFNLYQSSDPGDGAKYKCFYSGQSTSSVNREHVWAVSLSNNLFPRNNLTYAGADLHHVRPAIGQYNSIRSNALFAPVYGMKSSMSKINYRTGGVSYCTGNTFEPADAIKGDVARIIMYVYIHYSTKVGGNSQTYYGYLDVTKVIGAVSETECFALLRKWNALDPVSQDEITRNNVAYSVQGNRNPFIDHPTYADRIWG